MSRHFSYIEELIHIPYMITRRTDKTKSLFKDLKPYRVKQFYKALLQGNIDSFLCITTLSKDIRTKIDKNIPFLRYKDFRTVGDKRDLSYKAGLILLDDREIETVLMRNKDGHFTICLSTQVGCAVGCLFCATGSMGLRT